MAKIARVALEGVPYHITQRGNARQTIFSDAQDYRVYLKLLRRYGEQHRMNVWAWCLMTNHIHLLAVPETPRTLACTFGSTQREYARYRNARLAACGHIWQARYYSCPVENRGVWAVAAYIERNPVRAGMVVLAEDYPWSSARAHIADRDEDQWLVMRQWREEYTAVRWREVLRDGIEEEALQERLRSATATGRPFGSEEFRENLERTSGRQLAPRRVGRPKKAELAEIGY
jgi:putative transposase